MIPHGSVLETGEKNPVFVINAILLIPKVSIKPSLEDVQDVLVLAGKNITSVARGVGQWSGGKPQVSIKNIIICTINNR